MRSTVASRRFSAFIHFSLLGHSKDTDKSPNQRCFLSSFFAVFCLDFDVFNCLIEFRTVIDLIPHSSELSRELPNNVQ